MYEISRRRTAGLVFPDICTTDPRIFNEPQFAGRRSVGDCEYWFGDEISDFLEGAWARNASDDAIYNRDLSTECQSG